MGPYLGSMVGFVIFGYLADNIWRKNSIRISWTICSIGCALMLIGS